MLHGPFDVAAGAAEQGPVAAVEAELLAVRADEVQHRAERLALGRRRPRPSCCRNSVGLSVGRSMSTVSTAGTSTPSLNRSTENTTCTRPAARSRSAASRSASWAVAPDGDGGDAVVVEVCGHEPGVLDAHAEPQARIDVGSSASRTHFLTTRRAHASVLVYRLLSASTSYPLPRRHGMSVRSRPS